MRYISRTAGHLAKKFYAWAKENGHECLSFADSNYHLWGQSIDNVSVESLMKALKRYASNENTKIVVAVDAPVKTIRDICRELVGIGFDKSDILIVGIDFIKGNATAPTFMPYTSYNSLEYLEFHITHRCNLNCAGCSHFVPIIPKNIEVNEVSLKNDLSRLKELVNHIGNIRIMGGEPLLCSKLEDYCEFVRGLYPHANIKIVSNGILVDKMSDKLSASMTEHTVSLDITCYPPLYDKYDKIAKNLDKNGISCVMDIRWGMCPILHKDSNHKFRHDNTSLVCECYNLFDGSLYPCPPTAYIDFFNDYFGEHFPSDEGVNIYSCKSFQELWENVISKKKLCDYCNHYFMTKHFERRPFSMSKHPPTKEDYIREYDEK